MSERHLQSEDAGCATAPRRRRRASRRRSSIGKSSAKAIRNMVTKISTTVESSLLVDSDFDDDQSFLSLNESANMLEYVELDVGASDESDDDDSSVMSFSDLRPSEPVHVDVTSNEQGRPQRRALRKPSMDLMQLAAEEGLDENVETPPRASRTTLRKPSMDLLGMTDDESEEEEGEDDDEEERKEKMESSMSSMSTHVSRREARKPSLDLMHLVEAEALEDESKLCDWDDSSAISCTAGPISFPRSNSMSFATMQLEDCNYGDDEDEIVACQIQFLPQELNTKPQISLARSETRLSLPEMLSRHLMVEPLVETEAKNRTEEKREAESTKPKPKRSSKKKDSQRPGRRRSSALSREVGSEEIVSSSLRSMVIAKEDGQRPEVLSSSLRSLVSGTEDGRRSMRSEASRRSSMRGRTLPTQGAGMEGSEVSQREMKGSSVRRSISLEVKDPSARRSIRVGVQETNDSSATGGLSQEKKRSSVRGNGSPEMNESSRRRSRRTSSQEIKGSRRGRRSRRASSTQDMHDSSTRVSRHRRGSSAKPMESSTGRRLSRRSNSVSSVVEREDRRPGATRSFSCTRNESSSAMKVEHVVETTSSKRLSRRNSIASPSSGRKEDGTKKSIRRNVSHAEPEAAVGQPSMETKNARRGSAQRRSTSSTPPQKKKIADSALRSLLSPKIAPEPTATRRKSTTDGHKSRRREDKAKNSQKRHTTTGISTKGGKKEEELLPYVEPLQLVVDSISGGSNHTTLSCERFVFPAHTHSGLSDIEKSQHSVRSEAWSRTYSTVLRTPKQFRHEKPTTRAEVFHESLMSF